VFAQQPQRATLPPIRHVFLIVLAQKSYAEVFAADSPAPYLSKALPARGALLENYYAIGHWSLDNYIALVSGQAPNPLTQRDCLDVSDFHLYQSALDANGQALGFGCVYPKLVQSLPDQLEKNGLTWKGYMEDLGADPLRDQPVTCTVDRIGKRDLTGIPSEADQYASEHDPFVYFHSILDDTARCKAHVVNLDQLEADLRSVTTTPNYAFISPNLCNGGHDALCLARDPGGLPKIDAFLKRWVPVILNSPAFRKDGLLIVTFDSSDGTTPPIDYAACCGEKPLSSDPIPPGYRGPGGGKVGAVLLSPFIRPGTVSSAPYNHYALLRTTEDIFDLGHLGYAAQPGLRSLGSDVFTRR
jgi:hypothetical protein